MASVLSRIQIIMEANTANYNNEMRRARENSTTTFSKIGKSASKAALVVGTALAGMGALSVKTAMSFETAMAEVNKTADFVTEDGLGNLRKELEDLSKTMPLAFEELADIAASGGQMGIAGENLAQFTETIAKMGIAFDISAGQAAESMGFIASAYQVPIEKLGEVGDAINEVSNNSGATADKTIDFMLRTGAAANNMNIAAEATAAMGAAIIDAGGSVEKSGTAVSGMLLDMANPEWLKDNANLFKEMGVSTTEFAELVKTDGLAAFNLFREGIIATDDPMSNLRDAFGAAAPHVAKLYDETSKLVPLLDAVGQGAEGAATHIGSLDREYRVMADTATNAFVLMQNSARLVLAAAGEAFLPAVRQMTDALIPLVQRVADWAKANPELIQQITLISGSLLGTIVGLKLAVDGFTAVKTTIDGLKLGYAALTTTMGLTVLGLGILVAAGLLVYQNWDAIKKVVTENQPAFIALGVAVGAITVALIAANAPLILLQAQAALAAVQAGVMTVATASWSVAAGIAAAATWTFNAALAVLTSPIILVVAAIATIAAMGYLVVKNWGAISAGLRAEFERIKAAAMAAVNSMSTAWNSGVAKAKAAFTAIGNAIVNTVKGFIGRMVGLGRDFINGFINGIKSVGSNVVSAASGMVGNAIEAVRKRQNSNSDAKETIKLGKDFSGGMATGIKKGAKQVVTEAQKMAEGAIKAVQDGVAGLKREIALFGNDSALAALDYDIKVGKFGGANTGELRVLTEALEITKELASANDSVQSSIDGLIKKRKLFNNASEVASLEYDILYTDKFKNASGKRVQQLLDETKAVEGLANQLKATNAIKERFAQLEADRKSATNAFDGLEINGPQTEAEKLRQAYQNKMDIVDRFEQMHTDKKAQAEQARATLTEGFNQSIKDLEMQKQAQTVGSIAAMFGMALGETSKGYKAMFAVQKAYDFVQAQSASFTAIAKAWASAPFPANIPAVVSTTFQTGIIPAAIQALNPKGFMAGGYTGNYATNQAVGPVHGKEFVAHAEATRKYRPELEAMNNGTYVRNQGKASTVNMTIENHAGVKITQQTDDDGRIRLIVGEQLNKLLPQHVNNEYSAFNKSMRQNYHLQRNLG